MPDSPIPTSPEKPPSKVEDIFDMEKIANTPESETPDTPEKSAIEKKETTPEAVPEKRVEQEQPEDETARRTYMPPQQDQPAEPAPAAEKSEELIQVENILAEHLDGLFLQMTPQQQMEFKQKGEETATKIAQLLLQAKVKAKEVLNLIKDWLKFVPGVNKFFLEQEAKIKTDRIINIHEQKYKQK